MNGQTMLTQKLLRELKLMIKDNFKLQNLMIDGIINHSKNNFKNHVHFEMVVVIRCYCQINK